MGHARTCVLEWADMAGLHCTSWSPAPRKASSTHTEPAPSTTHPTGNHSTTEEPGTHLIFRLASIVLSILGREQRRVLLQAQGLQM